MSETRERFPFKNTETGKTHEFEADAKGVVRIPLGKWEYLGGRIPEGICFLGVPYDPDLQFRPVAP